jgi:hypothetical protein
MKHRPSEALMSSIFEEAVHGRLRTSAIPATAQWHRELPCLQGRPDFVAECRHSGRRGQGVETPEWQEMQQVDLANALTKPSLSLIISLLQPVPAGSWDYLLQATGFSRHGLHRTLRRLESTGLIAQVGANCYALSPSLQLPRRELWAFELKVDHWQRTLYQACQYGAFAHRTVVVIAEPWAHLLIPARRSESCGR